ncbi:MAG: tRNA lysidine(34) synthetase TilS [Thermoleophilia bacterium]|nr:tRNA lysidine(34) synthetase TilS [Thermoleophilia bacterium]
MCPTEDPTGSDRPSGGPGRLSEAIRTSGLVDPGDSGVILLSGGPDSAGLTAGLVAVLGPQGLVAVHLNYGLRSDSARDQAICERLCAGLGLELVIERPPERDGNLQDWARRARYAAAERIRAERGADWIAVGHTGSDLAETLIYRLASSPGVRPLLAMRARSGRVIRPLLALSRDETRRAAGAAGLEFADDLSNDDPAYARARIRNEVLPVLTGINRGARANMGATQAELFEDSRLLEELATRLLDDALAEPAADAGSAGRGVASPAVPAGGLEDADPALGRRAIRILAERTLGRPVPVSRELAERIVRLARASEGGQVDLGGGAVALIEAGRISVCAAAPAGSSTEPAGAISIEVPGEAEWQGWTVRADQVEPPLDPTGSDREPGAPERALVDRGALGESIRIRGWRRGDRIQPLGMEGSKSLQDVFTDRSIPRTDRRSLPVVLAGEEVVWVAGVALSHRFRIRPDSVAGVRITAARPEGR